MTTGVISRKVGMGNTKQASDSERLATNLRVLRARQGLGLVEAAQKIGIAEKTLIMLERGERRRAYAPTLRKLSEAYGVSVEELLAPEPQEHEPQEEKQAEPPISDEAEVIARRVVEILHSEGWGAAPVPLVEARTGSTTSGSAGATPAPYEEFLAMLSGMEKAYAPGKPLDWSPEEIISTAMQVMKMGVETAFLLSTPRELTGPIIAQAAEVVHLLRQRLPEGMMEEVGRRFAKASTTDFSDPQETRRLLTGGEE